MTISIAVTGKGGTGKTTVTKALLSAIHDIYPDKSVLLVDNDLSCELGYTFGIDIKNTIYDIKVNRFDYKSRLPQNMSRQEFVEWALQDITINLYDDIDIIASGLVSSKDCRCYIAEKINEALVRFIQDYDIVIFDCEYDLEYLEHLIDFQIDVMITIANMNEMSIYSAAKILESSQKYAPGQMGIIFNKAKNRQITGNISDMLSEYDLDVLGTLPYDENLSGDNLTKDSEILTEAVKELIFRLNLPPL